MKAKDSRVFLARLPKITHYSLFLSVALYVCIPSFLLTHDTLQFLKVWGAISDLCVLDIICCREYRRVN